MGDTAPPHQINHQHDHVARGGAGQDELPQFTTSRAGEGGALLSVVRGLKQRPGGQARPGEDGRGSSWCPPEEYAPGLHTGPHDCPLLWPTRSLRGRGFRSRGGRRQIPGRGHWGVKGTHPRAHILLHTHTHTAWPHGDGWSPPQQRAAATRPQHSLSHTHTHTSHELGPTVGAGDLSWESALRATPRLGFLAQYGGQESPILLQGWPRQENSSGGGWTDRRRGGQSRLCSAS